MTGAFDANGVPLGFDELKDILASAPPLAQVSVVFADGKGTEVLTAVMDLPADIAAAITTATVQKG